MTNSGLGAEKLGPSNTRYTNNLAGTKDRAGHMTPSVGVALNRPTILHIPRRHIAMLGVIQVFCQPEQSRTLMRRRQLAFYVFAPDLNRLQLYSCLHEATGNTTVPSET